MMIPAALAYAVTADAVVLGGRALFRGISLANTAADALLTATVYDAAIAADKSKPIFEFGVGFSGFDSRSAPTTGIAVERGIMVDLTGAGTCVVHANPETRILHALGLFDGADVDLTEWGYLKFLASIGER